MRVLVVDLRRSQNAAQLANHLLHFSKPSRPDKLWMEKKDDAGMNGWTKFYTFFAIFVLIKPSIM